MPPARRLRSALPPALRSWIREHLRPPGPGAVPVLLPRARADRVAVLAPHPDDDAIGCGGTLCKHCRAGDAVTVIYLTDGARGLDHAGPPSRTVARARRLEAEAAAARLGVRDLVFLELPDGRLAADRRSTALLAGALERAAPRAVFLPFLLDNHRDHRAANRIFAAATLRRAGEARVEVYAYEVWSPLPANAIVDITEVADAKEQAIRLHASQALVADYAGSALGLNRFRALPALGGRGFCEAFFRMEAGRYAELVQETLGGRRLGT